METRTLFGPYGTELAQRAAHVGEPALANPVSVLNGRHCGEAVEGVARAYLENGGNVGTVNAFGLRGLLGDPHELPTYRAALRGQHHALTQAIGGTNRATRQRTQRVISFGPAADCYRPEQAPGRIESADFHGTQAAAAAELSPDAAWFETVSTIEEGVGIALAAKRYRVPCVISFVLNRRGELLSGEPLEDAIRAVDSASNGYPLGYSLNCCPIEALEPALKSCDNLRNRVIGAYPNASSKSPDELDGSGGVIGVVDSHQTARYLSGLARQFELRIIGGCCGFTPRDIQNITKAVRGRWHSSHLPRTDVPREYVAN